MPRFPAILAVAVSYVLLALAPASLADERPNIIIILSDDMGYSDIGCYGGEIETPNLDKLAANGLRFTQFYNTGRCCPTRASLLTGLYPHQAGIGWMMADNGHDGYRGDLNRRCVTIAEVMKQSGYATYMTGKWHVTKKVNPREEPEKHNWPRQRGFDKFYGTIHGAGSFFDPNSLTRDNTLISPHADAEYKPDTYYYTDAISDHASRYIDEHKGNEPFFIYVAYTAAHWPMHALPRDIKKYEGRYDQGWDVVRAERHKRMVKMGLIDEDWGVAPHVQPWEAIKPEHRDWYAQRMEVYAAMVDSMDQGIGRIVEALKRKGQLDNTLVLYLQDNGGCQEEMGSLGPVRPDPSKPVELKPMKPTDLQYDMIPKVTRDGKPVRRGFGVEPGPADTYVAYGIEWANASNTPFRLYKHFVHEGGVATPLIAHWPARIKRKGELESQPGHLIDLMATCVDIAKATYPKRYADEVIQPMEGVSLAPAFDGKSLKRGTPIFFEHEGNRAMRDGKWKLVARGANGPWELYDLEADRPELNNLAGQQPDRVKDMAAQWDAWAKRANVYPLTPYYGNRRSQSFNKKQKRFELKAGADLDRGKAPFVEGRAIAINVTIDQLGDGVLVAQGGSADGYSLYVKDGVLTFATRRGGKLASVSSKSKLPATTKTVAVQYARDGKVTLSADGKAIATGDVGGAMSRMPIDGLQVGEDSDGAVGEYRGAFGFEGTLQNVVVEVGE